MFSPDSTLTTWRLAIERAADVALAFATLESITSVRELLGREPAAAAPHPHQREPLAPRLRPGRPGVVPARPHVCTTAPPAKRIMRSRPAHRANA
ncbi:MAG: hypothetical protein ABI950_05725 [Solirubrobacteraceae bacterium]